MRQAVIDWVEAVQKRLGPPDPKKAASKYRNNKPIKEEVFQSKYLGDFILHGVSEHSQCTAQIVSEGHHNYSPDILDFTLWKYLTGDRRGEW